MYYIVEGKEEKQRYYKNFNSPIKPSADGGGVTESQTQTLIEIL